MYKRFGKASAVLWESWKKYYGIYIVITYILLVLIFALVMRDNIYITINDNMDSNIPMYKMISDNDLFWKFDEPLPFLGGVLLRSQYRVELSIQSWLYVLMPPLIAYYVVYVVKIIGASLGFFVLSKSIKRYEDIDLNENIWCLCGFIYGILGAWPHAALGFASLPWWTLCTYFIYKTGKIRYIFLSLLFILVTSFTMLALFCLVYMTCFFMLTVIKDKKIHIPLAIDIILLAGGYFIANSHHVVQGISGSKETIKSLKSISYTESVQESIRHFLDVFMFRNSYYHTGGATLRYAVIPLCSIFLFFFILSAIKSRAKKKIKLAIIYVGIYAAIIINTLACCFDNNSIFRGIIPFASGFSFSRFGWISPFLWLVLLALSCEFLIAQFIKKYAAIMVSVIIISAFAVVIFDPEYTVRDSMYNELYCNLSALLGNDKFRDGNHEWTWREYYSEALFDQVKNVIDYDGSWSIAYGIEPSVLQFNGIKTLDGYYSNYSLKYHDIFQKLIKPELELDEHHKEYWESSSGMRAYIWSPEWDFISKKDTQLKDTELYINMDVFKEMGGKYIFSRFIITNADELELELLNKDKHSDGISPYNVYVYTSD